MDKSPTSQDIYAAASALRRHSYPFERGGLPPNGIYLFFERGEEVDLGEGSVPRIVRVGTHREDLRFPGRIRQHYGQVNSLKGNKNGSVFRLLVGGAILRLNDPEDPRLADWERHGGTSFPEVEELVSHRLRSEFSFSCFTVPDRYARLTIERALIATLAQQPINRPSAEWLGGYAAKPHIRSSGMWNTQHLNGQTMTADELAEFTALVGRS